MGSLRIFKKEYLNIKYLMMERKNVINLFGCVLCCIVIILIILDLK